MERKKLETAAADFSYLRGLFLIPLGLLVMLAGLGNNAWGPFGNSAIFISAALVLGLSCMPINRFYRDRYGRVSPSARQQAREVVAFGVSAVVMVGIVFLLRSTASWSLDLPVNSMAAGFAAYMLICTAITVGLRVHHIVIWGAVVLAGLLPVWNGDDPGNIGLFMGGAATVLVGIFDHATFVRTFGRPNREDSDVGV